jgi:hypothetical protein
MLTVSPKIIKFAKFLGARLRRHKKIPWTDHHPRQAPPKTPKNTLLCLKVRSIMRTKLVEKQRFRSLCRRIQRKTLRTETAKIRSFSGLQSKQVRFSQVQARNRDRKPS